MPMIARASVTANPIQAVPIMAPRASGCRAVPWMTEAKIKPTPRAGPMVPRPEPTMPRAPTSSIGVIGTSFLTGFRGVCRNRGWSVLLGRGRGDVLGGENGEDEGLQGLNEDLQAEDRHAEDQGHHTGGLVDDRFGMQEQILP